MDPIRLIYKTPKKTTTTTTTTTTKTEKISDSLQCLDFLSQPSCGQSNPPLQQIPLNLVPQGLCRLHDHRGDVQDLFQRTRRIHLFGWKPSLKCQTYWLVVQKSGINSPVEVGSCLSHYLQGFSTIPGGAGFLLITGLVWYILLIAELQDFCTAPCGFPNFRLTAPAAQSPKCVVVFLTPGLDT